MDHERAANWVGYRPEIKVIDCTIRDGGLMNNHQFDLATVQAVYRACALGGIDYMEIGYKNSDQMFSRDEHGPWKFCCEDDLKPVVESCEASVPLSIMADVGRCDFDRDLAPRDHSQVQMIRIACYIHQVPAALDMLAHAADKGFETCVNLMALSTVAEKELASALELFAGSPAKAIYVVDSFGSLYGEQVRDYVQLYLRYARQAGKDVGLHAHNNQQLAFANTIEAITQGANFVDGSLAGLGRGAGNCPTELISGFLHNPKYRLRPLLACIQDHILPLRAHMQWGPDIPYMIAGQLNQHPREAMKFNASGGSDLVAFYDQVTSET
ncbi:MAG: aldolase catalytic domain-containing protein [Planctomycetota bacterium]